MREIPLSRGYVAVVDDADFERTIAAGKWSACVKPKTVYALLRPADRRRNGHNTRVDRANNTSGFKGVTWHKGANKWASQIAGPGRQHVHLGLFVDPVDAARAYDAAALEYYGTFARPNFPTPTQEKTP